jgi:hypothetical protein
MYYLLDGVACGVVGFIVGFLVCRNNVGKIETMINELRRKIVDIEEIVKR